MNRCHPKARALITAAVVFAAHHASAGTELPYVVIQDISSLGASCQQLLEEAASLLPQAKTCDTTSGCVHYPCSCSAISRNEEAKRYMALVQSLQRDCGASIVYAYCGWTTPVCENGVCKTVSVPERPE